MKIDRRALLAGGLAAGVGACVPVRSDVPGRFASRLRIVEATANGTLGVAIYDTGSGALTSYNGFARFPHCSSFKLSLTAFVLKLGSDGGMDLDEKVDWDAAALLGHSPFTRERLATGATIRELAEAAQKQSDNTATNILLERIGGPQGMTAFWRAIGDPTSRLDRYELELNNVPAGEIMDTTSADAMALTVGRLTHGDVLADDDAATLRQWMVDTATGMDRVRAGLPPEWRAGDKTGTSFWPGMRSVYVDIGFVEPPDRAPLTFAAYYRANRQHLKADPASLAVFADVGRVITQFARTA